MNNQTTSTILNQAIANSQELLTQYAFNKELLGDLTTAFGTEYNREAAEDLITQWQTEDFNSFPEIEIRSSAEINGANGAYSADTNKIYIAEEYLLANTNNINAVSNLVVEEYGHYVDARINSVDAAGDEGDIFSRLVRGESFTIEELQELKLENDKAFITLDGEEIAIEQKTFNGGDDNDNEKGGNFAADDYLNGGGGNDTLDGEGGSDTLIGGDGNDKLFSGRNPIFGSDGKDFLSGGNGNDTLYSGSVGGDTLKGDAGDDDFILRPTNFGDVVDGGSGDDFAEIDRSGKNDGAGIHLYANGKLNDRRGGKTIINFRSIERFNVFGSKYSDVLEASSGNVTFQGFDGNDVLSGKSGDDTLYGGRKNHTRADGNDTLNGGDGNDVLFGQGGNDNLNGDDGNDQLEGGAGSDTLNGGAGDDTFKVTDFTGEDYFDGGSGIDTIILNPSDNRNLTIFGVQGDVGDGRGGGQHFKNIEVIKTGNGNDTFIGSSRNETFNGGAGNDTLNGGDGNDTFEVTDFTGEDHFDGGNGVDAIILNPSDNRDLTLDFDDRGIYHVGDGRGGGQHFKNIEIIETGKGDDTFKGTAGDDNFDGGAGNDKLNGEEGNDILVGNLGSDILDGDSGDDFLSVVASTDDATKTLTGGSGSDTFAIDIKGDVTLGFDFNVRELANFINDITLPENNGIDLGKIGTDFIFDALGEVPGASLFSSLAGNIFGAVSDRQELEEQIERQIDRANQAVEKFGNTEFGKVTNTKRDLVTISDFVIGEDRIKLPSIDENSNYRYIVTAQGGAQGGAFIGVKIGNADPTEFLLIKNQYNDGKRGGLNSTEFSEVIRESLKDKTGVIGAFTQSENPLSFSDNNPTIEGTVAFDRLVGSNLDGDKMIGSYGDDFINGLGGDDTLFGGTRSTKGEEINSGIDSLYANDGNDNLLGRDGNDLLYGETGDDILTGGAGNDTLTGGEGADTFVFDSLDGIDTIKDFKGNDNSISQIVLGSVGIDTIKDIIQIDTSVFGSGDINDISYNSSNGNLSFNDNQLAVLENPTGFDSTDSSLFSFV